MSKIRVLQNRALLHIQQDMRCPVAQSIMCLTADPGVTSSILNGSHTFVEIDQEIISMAILLPYADSRRVVVSYEDQSKITESWLISFYWVGSFG